MSEARAPRRDACTMLAAAALGTLAAPWPAAAASIALPAPALTGRLSVEAALQARRSVRSYTDRPLALAELGQLLWSAQGISGAGGLRTAPSAGALYPLEVYVAVGVVTGLAAGVYRYRPHNHRLEPFSAGDPRAALSAAALGQRWVARAPASVVLAAVPERTTRRYGRRGVMYVHMEVGHAAQNLLLQAVALGLGSVAVGAFDDPRVVEVLALRGDERPMMILPAGHRR